MSNLEKISHQFEASTGTRHPAPASVNNQHPRQKIQHPRRFIGRYLFRTASSGLQNNNGRFLYPLATICKKIRVIATFPSKKIAGDGHSLKRLASKNPAPASIYRTVPLSDSIKWSSKQQWTLPISFSYHLQKKLGS